MSDKPCLTQEPENHRVSLVRFDPECLVPGTRLRAKPSEEQGLQGRDIGDAFIREVILEPDRGFRYVCQTFVWRNEMTLSFEELIHLFQEATLPKGPGEQLYNLLFPLEI